MRPTFTITAAGKDITQDVTARLVSLDITDTVDETSDSLTLVLEDTSETLAPPASGARLEVSIGYDFRNVRLGSFVVDEVELDGPPDIFSIRASSTPFVSDRGGKGKAEFTSRKSRSWSGKTIGEIVETIAGECGLTPVVDQSLRDTAVPHIDQVAESDANLLLRIARRYGAVLKPADGRLVIASADGGQTTSGKSLELTLTRRDESKYRFKFGGKLQSVTKVKTKVHDYTKAESTEIVADVDKSGGQFLAPEGASSEQIDAFYEQILSDAGSTPETAKESAKTTAKRISRSKKQIALEMPGDPMIVAGMHVNLTQFRASISGRYKVISVRHSLSRSGYTTTITGEGAE